MVLEYAAGGELFDLIARRERVSDFFNLFDNKTSVDSIFQNGLILIYISR